jgi:hypothetical protein
MKNMSENNQIKVVALIGMWTATAVAAHFGHTNYVGWAMFVTFLMVA